MEIFCEYSNVMTITAPRAVEIGLVSAKKVQSNCDRSHLSLASIQLLRRPERSHWWKMDNPLIIVTHCTMCQHLDSSLGSALCSRVQHQNIHLVCCYDAAGAAPQDSLANKTILEFSKES